MGAIRVINVTKVLIEQELADEAEIAALKDFVKFEKRRQARNKKLDRQLKIKLDKNKICPICSERGKWTSVSQLPHYLGNTWMFECPTKDHSWLSIGEFENCWKVRKSFGKYMEELKEKIKNLEEQIQCVPNAKPAKPTTCCYTGDVVTLQALKHPTCDNCGRECRNIEWVLCGKCMKYFERLAELM